MHAAWLHAASGTLPGPAFHGAAAASSPLTGRFSGITTQPSPPPPRAAV
jgi:hypothetical protein